jgi:hypothetical protein
MKCCIACDVMKPLDDYYVESRSGKPLQRCKACVLDANRKGRQRRTSAPKITPETALCRLCNGEKPASEFSSRSDRSSGLHLYCKDCEKIFRQLRKYNLTLDAYEGLLASQNGLCACCGRIPTDRLGFTVDHDHKCCPDQEESCGSCVRGLVCSRCNVALGLLKDSPDFLRKAAQLKRRRASNG